MSLGRRREEGKEEGQKQVHQGCPLSVLSSPLPPSLKEHVSVGGFPGSPTACVPTALQTAAPCPYAPATFSALPFVCNLCHFDWV